MQPLPPIDIVDVDMVDMDMVEMDMVDMDMEDMYMEDMDMEDMDMDRGFEIHKRPTAIFFPVPMIPTLLDTSVAYRRNIASRNGTIVIVLSAAVAFGSTEVLTETASTWSPTVSIVELLPNS